MAYDVEGIRPPSDKSLLRGAVKPGEQDEANQVNMCELVLLPWLLLAFVMVCYLIAGANGQIAVLWIMPLVLVLVITAFIGSKYSSGDSDEVVLGFLMLMAVLIGTGVGLFGNFTSLQELHRINQGASYFNVLPSEPAASKMDASSMVFVNGTRVNTGEFFGFTDASSALSPIYCVAPITNGEAGFKRIEYWAAGINCCSHSKPFTCGQVQDSGAHGGLLLAPELQDGERKKFFESAIKGALDKYGLVGGNDYILLNWMPDPIKYRDDLWHGGWKLFAVFGGVYLVISAMLGFVIYPILKS
eukprot:CAMPEP_0114693632 /NCGR_PEP_ID=MMETSP0191-20121206/69270_1 /TAXON_ID=126664 /ORGANISM="Sorites sp." /LENGTH=300 /DNA_ID=CAMNT_0001987505 /DNA_START=121 /DNA_END=1020 /DNA_ORIENTATION=+